MKQKRILLLRNFFWKAINSNFKKSCISEICNQFGSGHFYKAVGETSDYTPYNWYFIEKMEKLFEIFAQLTKVRLPYFIEKFINKELSDEYEYSYFQENPEEDINHLSICFNLEQIDALLKNMDKLKDKIFISTKSIGLKKTLEKLLSKNSQELLKHILNMEKLDNDIQTKNQKTKKRDKNKEEKEKDRKSKITFFFNYQIIN